MVPCVPKLFPWLTVVLPWSWSLWGFHNSAVYSDALGCDTVTLGKWFLTFWRTVAQIPQGSWRTGVKSLKMETTLAQWRNTLPQKIEILYHGILIRRGATLMHLINVLHTIQSRFSWCPIVQSYVSSGPMRCSRGRFSVGYRTRLKCVSLCAHVSFRHYCTFSRFFVYCCVKWEGRFWFLYCVT
jgi:hypothetical protein